MQTLRKKNSPCKLKNEPTRFMGEGVSFKAKLIGILEVSEARGDRMCQAALADLKMAIRAAGEHKQRITVQISIDGLRLRDEKTGDCLYHHPVHKISFIAQDMSDSRAFGYIFGSPDTGHRFFGIKTDKAASQVVIAMRDLFQVVFELKKKEIELAKQHIEHSVIKCGTFALERTHDTKGAAGSESSLHRTGSDSDRSRKHEAQSGVVADLLDLQFELNSLQQGIHQMDKITPDNPRPVEDPFESDPFGDSFANMKIKEQIQPILPPPPSASKRGHFERQQTVQQTPTSGTSSPANIVNSKTPPHQGSVHWFDKETEDLFNEGELSNLTRKNSSSDEDKEPHSAPVSQDHYKQIDIFSELDPLGTGIKKPYVDKKDFFQHLKNPPKKVLKDLALTNSEDTFPTNFNITSDSGELNNSQTSENESNQFDDGEFADFDKFKEKDISTPTEHISPKPQYKESNKRSIQHQSLSVSLPPEDTSTPKTSSYGYSMSNSVTSSRYDNKDSSESIQSLVKLPSPKKYLNSRSKTEYSDYGGNKSQSIDRSFPVDFSSTSESPASPLRSCSSGANSRLSSSSAEMENVPEPPPRGAGSILINPPPLPPKKHSSRSGIKPPPRPPHGDGHFHYDFLEREEGSPSPTRKTRGMGSPKSTRGRFDDNFNAPLPDLPKGFSNSKFEDSFNTMIQSPKSVIDNPITNKPEINWANLTKDITLSQLTSTFLTDLADNLGMSVAEVTSLTLQQLTECIESLAKKDTSAEKKSKTPENASSVAKDMENSSTTKTEKSTFAETSFDANEPLFKATFDQEPKVEKNSNYDKYAVFRELLEMEQVNNEFQTQKSSEEEEAIASENQDEPGDIEDDAQSDEIDETIASLANLTVKLPPVSESQTKEVASYYEMKSNDEPIESPKESDNIRLGETESEKRYYSKDNVNETDSSMSDLTKIQSDKEEKIDNDEIIEDTKNYEDFKDSDNFVITAEEVNELSKIVDKKTEIKPSVSTSSDKYAALREIIEKTEQTSIKTDNFVTSPNKSSVRSSTEVDLQGLFSDNFSPQSISVTAKITTNKEEDVKTTVMDIFEEIKMLNTDTHRSKETKPLPLSSNLESVFSAFTDIKPEKESSKDDENWAKFESTVFQSDKSAAEGQGSMGGTSPWSPEGIEFNREPPIKRNVHRHSGESDNEWKDDEESEESNGRSKGEGSCCVRHPRYDLPPFEERPFYDETAEGDKDRVFREKMVRKTRGAPWVKSAPRTREPMPWHDDARWEEERRRHLHRKVPYKDEEEYKTYWKCRPKQRPWNGEREGFWGPDHPFYEEECKRRMTLWTEEERDSRERFSSQESMGYEEDERWFRREYERRRYEEDGMFWRGRGPEGEYPPREAYKKHDPHYFREGRDRHYDYPPSWEEEYGPKRAEDSPRYLTRKKHWPKRPNSANDGREMMYVDIRPKCAVSRSECSDNDSDPYHRPYRSRSRESYWGSDQEFESWGERPYWSEGPDAKNESLHRKRMNRHRSRPQPKSQSSPFEDDFTQSVDRSEAPIDPVNAETRIRPEVEMKQPTSPRSPRGTKEQQARREPKSYKASSYFDDDLTPTASASSDASDRQRIGSDLKVTPEELPCDVKDPVVDGFASEDSGRDSFFNGDPRFDDDAFAFRSELEDQVPEHATNLPMKNSRHLKYTNSRGKGDQYIKKSESINIFSRENDPFDDDEFFN
ncbi:protein disabled [Nasonia vitripennis]|uniref:PID domain-containing protein n=1 Tax=Nasonia vitripennis TaxID=7425 RepID=A0A7M7IW03_NASVI|nr:protein disabled [Nasonia vitripennis]